MRSLETKNMYFNYNSDLSGTIKIIDKGNNKSISLTKDDLKGFSKSIIRDKIMSLTEDIIYDDALHESALLKWMYDLEDLKSAPSILPEKREDKNDYTELIHAINVLRKGITICKMYFRECEYSDALRYEEQEIPILYRKGMLIITAAHIKGIIDYSLSEKEVTLFHNCTEVINVLREKDIIVDGEFTCQEQPHVLINHGVLSCCNYLPPSSISYDEFRVIAYVRGFLDNKLNVYNSNDVALWYSAIARREKMVCYEVSLSGKITACYLPQSVIDEMDYGLRVFSKNFDNIRVLDTLKKHNILTEITVPCGMDCETCYEIIVAQFLRVLAD